MSWFRAPPLLLLAAPAMAVENYIVAAGVQADTADARALAGSVSVATSERTWWSLSGGFNTVEILRGQTLNTRYYDIGFDHHFDPLGLELEAAYWGDNDILDSIDARASVYWQNEKYRLSADFEYRDFEFDLPTVDTFEGRDVRFHANGYGLTGNVQVTDSLSFSATGVRYDYSVPLRIDDNRDIINFLSISRLSLIASLIDYRVGADIGLNVGESHWSVDYYTWKGAVDGGKTDSTSLQFLTPLGKRFDIELSFGHDRTELYGSANVYSVFFYFYGGN